MGIREEIEKNMADSEQCYQYWKENGTSPKYEQFYRGEISAFRFVLSILNERENVKDHIAIYRREKKENESSS